MTNKLIWFTFSLLDSAHSSEAYDNEEVKDGDGSHWNGEAERERIPNERLFGCHHFAFWPLDSTRYVTFVLYRPGHPQTSLTLLTPAVPNCCCWNGLAPYWSNPPFLIFDIRALWRSGLSARAPECQKLTSSSAMAEGPRELDQRFQVGGQFEAKS